MYRFARTSPQDPRAIGLTGALGLQLSDNSVLGKSTLFDNPPQLVDPSLRGGDALFPNLRVGNFGREALAEDLAPYRVAKMFRPDAINMNASNPRLAKASNDIQFQKAGQSPGQAKALGELIRKDPVLGNSFNVGYGSTLNREQGLAQKQGRVYEFDPTDEMWKSGFRRKNPDIVAMGDLQDALLTMPSGSRLTTYDGRPLDPSFTKAYYNLDATQDINDPQLFYNLKGKADVDYGRIAQALSSIPIDKTKKADYSLAKRWERVQGYSPYPPRGATYVLNADKPYQSVDEIIADVDQVEGWYSPQTADKRAVYSRTEGNNDNRNIPTRADYEEWVRSMGDSINLEPDDYDPSNKIVELFGGIAADRQGNTFPLTRLKRKESSVIGREFDESNARSAFTFPIETKRAYKLLRDGNPVIENRTFLLNQPEVSGINYYDPTGKIVTQNRPSTRLETQYTAPFFNPYRRVLPQGEIEMPNGMVVNSYSPVKPPELARIAWADESILNPNTSERIKGLDTYYRIGGQNFSIGEKEGLSTPFFSPEVILPSALAGKYQPYTGNMGYSPNNYRKATLEGKDVNKLDITKLSRREAAKLKDVGFYEFNDIMDEGVRTSKDIDRLYGLNDELAYLSDIARKDDMYADILGYEQSNVIDKIVEAERKQQDMGGTYRALTGTQDQGSFEQERMAYEGRPSALTQYNVDEILEPSFGSDYSGKANTGRIRVPSGIDYDAGIPVPTTRTRLASGAIDPIQLQDDVIEPFNQAQYTRDMIDRGGVLIDTQLGVPIIKAPTTAYNPVTQRNESYLQPVRPSRVANGVANWQAPESLAIGRVGRQAPIQGIPELPTDTGMTVERRASSPMAAIQRELLNNNSVSLTPWSNAPLPSRDWTTTTQGQLLYPNAGIGPINTGLKPKPFLSELFGFSAISPEGLAKYRDMS